MPRGRSPTLSQDLTRCIASKDLYAPVTSGWKITWCDRSPGPHSRGAVPHIFQDQNKVAKCERTLRTRLNGFARRLVKNRHFGQNPFRALRTSAKPFQSSLS